MPEITARFGLNDHRRRLLSGFNRGVAALMAAGCTEFYLDGSFVTSKEFPRDYDACWEATGVIAAKLDPVFGEFSNGRAAQKARFLGEFFPAHYRTTVPPSSLRTYLEFFQIDRNTGDPKGIIGITMKATP
jgi:hypothetical protein